MDQEDIVSPIARRIPVTRVAWAAAAAFLAVGAAGCASSSSGGNPAVASNSSSPTASSAAGADPTIAAEVPASIRSKGTLVVAADATYAPNEFIAPDGHTVVGMDADLAKALAGVMGLKVSVKNVTFDAIIPGLAAGKYDLGMSSFTDTKAREKTVDFVTYFSAGTSFFVKASGGPTINSLSDLCGHKVSVEKGTTEQTDAQTQDAACKRAHKAGVRVDIYDTQNGANLALQSGHDDVGMADSPVAAYEVKQSNGIFKLSGQPYGTAPYGIAIPKGNGMARPVLDALKKLMTDGTYTQILSKWGIQSGAITNPVINGATS
jgi:polar amino acid transport system substrate-binding protein